jgi:hypothetical protein
MCFSIIRTVLFSNSYSRHLIVNWVFHSSDIMFRLFLHTLHKHCEMCQFNFGERRSGVNFTYEYRCFMAPIGTSKLKLNTDGLYRAVEGRCAYMLQHIVNV